MVMVPSFSLSTHRFGLVAWGSRHVPQRAAMSSARQLEDNWLFIVYDMTAKAAQ